MCSVTVTPVSVCVCVCVCVRERDGGGVSLLFIFLEFNTFIAVCFFYIGLFCGLYHPKILCVLHISATKVKFCIILTNNNNNNNKNIN